MNAPRTPFAQTRQRDAVPTHLAERAQPTDRPESTDLLEHSCSLRHNRIVHLHFFTQHFFTQPIYYNLDSIILR